MINRFEWLKSVKGVTSRAKRLASILAINFMNDKTGQCNPSIETLAAEMECSKDTVKRAREDLVRNGYLIVIPGRGRGNSSQFRFTLPKSSNQTAKGVHKRTLRAKKKGRNTALKSVQACTPLYKDEQYNEQKRSENVTPPAFGRQFVDVNNKEAVEGWNNLLSHLKLGSLKDYESVILEGSKYVLPLKFPPDVSDAVGIQQVRKYFECVVKGGAGQ